MYSFIYMIPSRLIRVVCWLPIGILTLLIRSPVWALPFSSLGRVVHRLHGSSFNSCRTTVLHVLCLFHRILLADTLPAVPEGSEFPFHEGLFCPILSRMTVVIRMGVSSPHWVWVYSLMTNHGEHLSVLSQALINHYRNTACAYTKFRFYSDKTCLNRFILSCQFLVLFFLTNAWFWFWLTLIQNIKEKIPDHAPF